jgi:hypothetical protein
MSLITNYTIRCNRELPEQCTEHVGPFPSADEARQAAVEAGWKLHRAYGYSPEGDACPAHIAPLDRVDWGSTN